MPAETLVDEVVNLRGAGASNGSLAARAVTHESVDPQTGDVKVTKGQKIEQDDAPQVGNGRRFKASTEALLAKLEAPPGEEGDADEDTEAEGDAAEPEEGDTDAGDAGDDDGADEGDEGDAEEGEGESADEEGAKNPVVPDEIKQWQAKAQQYEDANKRLLTELDQAKKTPVKQRSEHEQTLVDAYQSYVDEGSVPALRKFIGAVISAKPDSKEVDAELSGLYADLTERELNVPLDQSQKALREAARARLALARDKRERAAESEKKQPAADESVVEAQRIEQASKFIDTQLTVKGQSGASLADEYPLLVALAEDFDGIAPAKLIATAIMHEIKVGGLTGAESNEQMIRHVAKQIETHYTTVKERVSKALPKQKTDTTKSGTAAAKPASKEQRQKQGTRTISNATASVAPATLPKAKVAKEKTGDKQRKDFKSEAAWRDYILAKHIPNR